MHTPILWVLALKIMSRAIFWSAEASTYTWQLPVPVSMTGMVLFSTTVFISPAPPLGMSTSMYLFRRISSLVVSLLVSSISWTESSGRPALESPARRHRVMAMLE